MTKKEFPYIPVAVGVAAIVLYKDVLKPITNFLGLTKSEATKQVEAAMNIANNKNPFSPQFYKSAPAGAKLLTDAQANNLAATIRASFSFYQDNEDQVLNIFRNLKTQSQVSFLADKFQKLYGADLLSWLRGGSWPDDRLDDNEMSLLLSIVNKLPKYY